MSAVKSSPQTKSIDRYIASYPPKVQRMLQHMRRTIRAAAPDAEETISYGIPTFRLHGNLVHFAAFKNHIGFYPTSAGVNAFRKQANAYITGPGTMRFPINEPIPYDLVDKIVRFRVKQTAKPPR